MNRDETSRTVERLLARRNYPREPRFLLAAMQDVRAALGYLPEELGQLLCDRFRADRVLWQQLFPTFRHTPPKPHRLERCRGPVCAQQPLEIPAALLDDARIEVVDSHCLGDCHHAPLARFDGRAIPGATPEKLTEAVKG